MPVKRHYRCKICDATHSVSFDKALLEGRTKFPFPHTQLHGELKDILSIFYLDKDLQIRGVEIQNIGINDDNIFSKEQSITITDTLMNEIERLREENEELSMENDELRAKLGE